MTKRTSDEAATVAAAVEAAKAAIVADICLYGNSQTGAGWLARTRAGLSLGSGEPRATVSFTEAVWAACGGLTAAAGLASGTVRVFAPGGERMATIELGERIPTFGDLAWSPAPVYALNVETLLNRDDRRRVGRHFAKFFKS